jgi:signal transduction histidine kinase
MPTPLTSVTGPTEATGAEIADRKPTARLAGRVGQGERRLLRTLDGVLSLSRVEGGTR